MSVHELTARDPLPIRVRCPMCDSYIPVITLSARASGRRSLVLHVEGHAEDWVVHLWSHDERDC